MEVVDAKPWAFYIIQNNKCTYAGVSPDPFRRLRQHNGEIVGGAKYTTSKGPGWTHVCIITGFKTKIQVLQFEWAVKHEPPRGAGGFTNRIKKLFSVCNKDKWTSNAPISSEVPLKIYWNISPDVIPTTLEMPAYITQTFEWFTGNSVFY